MQRRNISSAPFAWRRLLVVRVLCVVLAPIAFVTGSFPRVGIGAGAPSSAQKDKENTGNHGAQTAEVKITAENCLNAVCGNMPGGMSALVELEGQATTPECAAVALGAAKDAVNDSAMIKALRKAAAIGVDLIGKVTGYGLPTEIVKVFLESTDASSFKGKLGEAAINVGAGKAGGAVFQTDHNNIPNRK